MTATHSSQPRRKRGVRTVLDDSLSRIHLHTVCTNPGMVKTICMPSRSPAGLGWAGRGGEALALRAVRYACTRHSSVLLTYPSRALRRHAACTYQEGSKRSIILHDPRLPAQVVWGRRGHINQMAQLISSFNHPHPFSPTVDVLI